MDNSKSNNTINEQIIIDSIPAWIFYKSKNNEFIRVNNAFCKAFGKSRIDLEGKSIYDIFPKDQADKFWEDDKKVIKSGKAITNIIEKVDTALGERWVQTNKIPLRDISGEITGVIGFAIDITEQKKAESEKEESHIMLQKIIDLLPIRIFWKDKNLNYLGCNQVFAKDAGKNSTSELIGKDDYQMGWKDQAEMYRKDDTEVLTSGKPKINYEEVQTTPDGRTIWLNTNKVPLVDNKNQIIGILGTYNDITNKKTADDQLKEALTETKKLNDIMINREIKMIELKKMIEDLKKQS